jgi:hypothetical protein
VTSSSFQIRYAAPVKLLLTAVGMGPAESRIQVTPEELCVHMGWAFHASIPIHHIQRAQRSVPPLILGCGVHGWAGRWLVNGSRRGVVRLKIHPAARARVVGVPVRLATLLISVTEPKEFLATINRIRVA